MLIIIGASGFLGSYAIRSALEQTDEDILAVSSSGECAFTSGRVRSVKCDVCDYSSVSELANQYNSPNAKILYLAACHNVDYVEQYPREAEKVNIDALNNFLKCFAGCGRLLFSSSDTVYGEGSEGVLFNESSPLVPVNVYGAQKAMAESLVGKAGGVSVRFPFLAGRSLNPKRKNFSDVIAQTVLSGKSIVMFTDAVRSVLDYNTTALLVLRLFEYKDRLPSVINVCGDDALSKYDIGCAFAETIGVDSRLIIPEQTPVDGIRAPRALYAAMDNSLLKSILGIDAIHIDFSKI